MKEYELYVWCLNNDSCQATGIHTISIFADDAVACREMERIAKKYLFDTYDEVHGLIREHKRKVGTFRLLATRHAP